MSWGINQIPIGGAGQSNGPTLPTSNPNARPSLSASYPRAIDDVPTINNDQTVVTAIWLNFLQTLIETVESVIGPIGSNGTDEATWVAGQPNLMTMLDRVSLASNSDATFQAGRLAGFERMIIRSKVRDFVQAYNTSLRMTPFEPDPRISPVVFVTMQRTNHADESQLTATEMERSCIVMRGWAAWRTATPRLYDFALRGITFQGSRAPGAFNLDQERIAHVAIFYFQT